MPELPDVEAYASALRQRLVGEPLDAVRLVSPFLLRSAEPPVEAVVGQALRDVSRLGKRLVWSFEDDLFLVLHLMIAGRLRLTPRGAAVPGKVGLAAFDFPSATIVLTEASSQKRASLHVVRGRDELALHDPGGVEPLEISRDDFRDVLSRENHTLKRALTDPRLLSGIGNAYSDEILHRARLSPLTWTSKLTAEQWDRLFDAVQTVLGEWRDGLVREADRAFPEKVTAFRDGMAVHGRYGKPCPDCGTAVQRIRYAKNETNYCAQCQTGGRLLADRSLSRLLKGDWPRSLDELERIKKR